MELHLDDFKKIDAHIHYNHLCDDALNYAVSRNFRLVTVNSEVAYFPSLSRQERIVHDLRHDGKTNVEFITSFSTDDWGKTGWQDQAIDQIETGLNNGAIGVKMWKNIGMVLRDKNGRYILIDDPSFDPIFDHLESNNIPLLNHLAEPRNCWMPLDDMTVENDRFYFKEHPEYHMYRHPEIPSYRDQLQARDRMLAKHPKLRYIGAHLATLEWSVGELSKWLSQFPNSATDLAARMCHLQYQAVTNRDEVRDFMIFCQDRIIYGTDLSRKEEDTPRHSLRETLAGIKHTLKRAAAFTRPRPHDSAGNAIRDKWGKRWDNDWKFLATNDTMSAPEVKKTFQGLALPRPVLHKIYCQNALKWYPNLQQHS